MNYKRKLVSGLALCLCGASLAAYQPERPGIPGRVTGQTETTSDRTQETSAYDAERYTFSTDVYGPGVTNLSSSDSYSRYQWGLKNDAELQYSEITNRFKDSNPKLATYIDLANYLGMPAPVAGPDAYRIKETRARKGVDINVLPAWNLYNASTEEHRQVVVESTSIIRI